ncbi:MAG: glycosyltransferase family 39 protein [Candidatus Sungbacteria bacterium]|nr:glycosyltransferase family 39 protein [Candidatus Sungbacteria bacterium]
MSRRELLTLLGIVILAFFLRIWQLPSTPPGLYPDEAMNGNNALEALKTGEWRVFYPENNGREGLFINIQALLLKVTGEQEPWVLRFPSAVFGTLTVLGAFFLFRELAKFSGFTSPFLVAAAGSFFLATSHWHLIFSRIGFRAIMAPFFLVWAVYFFLLAVRNQKFRYALLSGASLGLGVYSYIAYRIMPLIFLSFVPTFWKRRGFWHMALGFAISAVVVGMPLFSYFLEYPADFLGRTNQVSIFSSETPLQDLARNIGVTVGMFLGRGDGNWRHNVAGAPQLFWPVGILFLLGVVVGIRQRSLFDVTFFVWLFLAALPVVISNEGLPHALRAILMIPAVFAFAGRGAASLWQYAARHRLALSKPAALIFLLLMPLHTYFLYFEKWGEHPETARAFAAEYAAIGREINALPAEVHKYVVVAAPGVDVRGIPMPAQTVMFITDSFAKEEQERKRIHYLLPEEYQTRALLPNSRVFILE